MRSGATHCHDLQVVDIRMWSARVKRLAKNIRRSMEKSNHCIFFKTPEVFRRCVSWVNIPFSTMVISLSSVNKLFPVRQMHCVMKERDGDGHPQFEIWKPRERERERSEFENPFHKNLLVEQHLFYDWAHPLMLICGPIIHANNFFNLS